MKAEKELDDIVRRILNNVDGVSGHRARMSYYRLTHVEYGYVRYKVNQASRGNWKIKEDWHDF